MDKIMVIHGANLNNLAKRESFYGGISYDTLIKKIADYATLRGLTAQFFCSNHEGEIIEAVQNTLCPLIINSGAFTHTSLAIADALKCLTLPKIEVHLTNIHTRGRHISLTGAACDGCITGLGIHGYYLAIDFLADKINNKS